MEFIGFFQNVFTSIVGLVQFVSTPLGELTDGAITIEPFASASIMNLLSVSLIGTLGVLLAFHLVRLFIGG